MQYASIISIIFYICGCFYMFFGIYTMLFNSKSNINRRFLLLTLSMAVWSFSYSFSTSAPTTKASAFWDSLSVFGWGFFYNFFLHFVLTLTNSRFQPKKLSYLLLFYFPSLINILLFAPFGTFAGMQYALMPSRFGWGPFLFANLGQIWIAIYATVYSIVAIILLIRWWHPMDPRSPMKRYVTYFLVSTVVIFVLGSLTDIFSDVLGLTPLPRLAIVLLVAPTILLFIILKQFGMLLERTRVPFSPLGSKVMQDDNRLRLFQTAATIFAIGAAGSFFTGYFLAGAPFAHEFALALFVWALSICLLYIPRVTNSYATQNVLFLLTSLMGMSFFLFKDVSIGSATVWAIYIIFLLYSIVLDSRIITLVFLVITLLTQLIIWLLYPEVNAVIDGAQYLKRIFIIVLSYFAIQYLTQEYASKLQGYQIFAKEQETLEIISTNFISVDRDNFKQKIDEMFAVSAEVLNFDNAYLFELTEDYSQATILNMYVKDVEHNSSPYRPGTTFQTADFPEIKPLLDRNTPLMSEDVTSLSVDDAGDQRNFFVSRGIHSFFTLPITVDDKTAGFFVVEYRERSDNRFTESRLHFLRIIANILGDTRKKILYEEQLYEFAYFDESTQLANRNMLRQNIEQLLHDRIESEPLVLFHVELDNLRVINDSFGHDIGEQVVIESAAILTELMREGCTLSRTSEGTFIVVMPIAETNEQIDACAKQIIAAFSDPIVPRDGIEALFVTPTIGISVYPDDGSDADTLLKNADLAAYEAKASDNRIVFCSEQIKSRIEENALLTNRLFKSLKNKEFSLEFQPQISCSTGKAVGVEALLRWTTDNKRISPDIFIPMLEQTGLIHDVGLWVLEQTLLEHTRLVAKGFPPIRFSVNLSIAQLRKENFVPDVLTLIEKHQVRPKYVELEITESLLSKNFSDTVAKLSTLQKSGINIAVDDFGKGYSSLHRLELVPFNRIKIDKSIVDDISLQGNKRVMVQVIVSLAKAFMASITVEGVETEEQVDFLREIGCDEIQGYYYAKPMPTKVLEEFLKKSL